MNCFRKKSRILLGEREFRVLVVHLILSKETEKAIDLVCKRFGARVPSLAIGIPKGHKKALAVYEINSNSIKFADKDSFFDPFVVLHELYHCLRSSSGKHRGTEKNADRFAGSYIREYNSLLSSKKSKVQLIHQPDPKAGGEKVDCEQDMKVQPGLQHIQGN
jgi:hypothetical protein